jgi:hypothetical protein
MQIKKLVLEIALSFLSRIGFVVMHLEDCGIGVQHCAAAAT